MEVTQSITYSMSPTLLGGDYILASLQIPGRRIIEEDESRDERKLVHRLVYMFTFVFVIQ